ncbi:MAG: SUMF1/EgtB/PvdO family nonheme iron enzyme [Deltaproteobacteria bacterium]|nr:SUMF1/EgtB/PvdO family nonheme iron enzyme [Deltaproteobacteria bacterium]
MRADLARYLVFVLSLLIFAAVSCDRQNDKGPAIKEKQASGNGTYGAKPDKTAKSKARLYTDTFTGIEFVFIKGGCYKMGDIFGDGDSDERPVHKVCVDDFYMSKYETTQGQWAKVMGDNPSRFKSGVNYPVENVSWSDVQAFIGELTGVTGMRYRLPTEAEWEYAARSGGNKERFAGFSEEADLFLYSNFCDRSCESHSKTTGQDDRYRNSAPVGRSRPNGLGLYDMTGNVWEWVRDWYDETYYKTSPKSNPSGASGSSRRVIRGGSWDYEPRGLRVIDRDGLEPDKRSNNGGFRLVLPLK